MARKECLHCGKRFPPRKRGHVFCSVACRLAGERKPHERPQTDQAAIARLLDPGRDPSERVRQDDWHPAHGPHREEWVKLDRVHTVEQRRRWFKARGRA